MDQIHNHYSEPVTVQGANYQSHYVPAEKPYAVYAYCWEGPTMAIAQFIGTMLTGNVDKDGKMKFDGKAVYRMPCMSMLDFEHCFIPEDMGPLVSNTIHLGFVGDTVGIDTLVKAATMEITYTPSLNVDDLIANMQLAGLKVKLDNEYKMQDVTGCIDIDVIMELDSRTYYNVIAVEEGIALRIKLCKDGESEKPQNVLSSLWNQIQSWKKIGVTFEHIRMTDKYAEYQNQIDELQELTKLYGKYAIMGDDDYLLYKLLSCLVIIGKSSFFYDDYVMAMKKVVWDAYEGYDKDLQMGINLGYICRDGNILQFSPDFECMAKWEWKWLHDEDKK